MFSPVVVGLISPSFHVLLAVVFLGLFDVDLSDVLGGANDPDGPEGKSRDVDDFEDDDFFDDTADLGEPDEFSSDEEFDDDDDFSSAATDATEPLEARIDEIENDVEGISNTISTVRSENEEIKESVASVEENVRKLLEIYEYVTSGANPFVDDVPEANSDDDSFGLFSGKPAGEEKDPAHEATDLPVDLFGLDADVELETQTEEPADDGRTFEELKAEYETADRPEVEADDGFQFNDPASSEVDSHPDSEQAEQEPPASHEVEDDDHAPSDQFSDVYLDTLPEGYGTEFIVLEWIEYLYRHGGIRGTHRALAYYENLSWISEEVATELRSILSGFTDDLKREGQVARTDGAGELALGIEHHRKSLEYISLLTGWEVTPRSFDIPGDQQYGI